MFGVYCIYYKLSVTNLLLKIDHMGNQSKDKINKSKKLINKRQVSVKLPKSHSLADTNVPVSLPSVRASANSSSETSTASSRSVQVLALSKLDPAASAS